MYFIGMSAPYHMSIGPQVKAKLNGDIRNLNADLDNLREALEEEAENKGDIQRLLAKTQNEMQQLKAKFEGSGSIRSEELDEAKRKFMARIHELEEEVRFVLQHFVFLSISVLY